MSRQPNLFLIGAPKCGTTALYAYLRTHPHIFLPEVIKEPHYYSDDVRGPDSIDCKTRYLSLFSNASDEHRWIGEASTGYLRSCSAVLRILRDDPDSRFIVMLRNPIDMVQSWHSQMIYMCLQDKFSFSEAWKERMRVAGNGHNGIFGKDERLQYHWICSTGTQCEQFLSLVRRKNVHFILFDDFAADPASTYRSTLKFLELSDDGRSDFPRINAERVHRFPKLTQFLMSPPEPLRTFKQVFKLRFGLWNLGLGNSIYERLSVKRKRPALSLSLHRELIDCFSDEIQKLSDILARDLTHWISQHTVEAYQIQ